MQNLGNCKNSYVSLLQTVAKSTHIEEKLMKLAMH
ncbi:hypothetical protein AWRI1631_41590 [Saccharomyces cerevisiae AWRI1631]|uniref:Uncharacterized protein n=1 Tax=Saccharomyces cerevisiae (strain AWRI1631) TaxID=545124 RepID=B5VFI8_YEAS6|nr:hypothetical protein AWRI1631_41590 [Saccharomyces cerevisiae AWRI1631]